MKIFRGFIFLFCLVVTRVGLGLVNPESTNLPIPSWSADIFVVGKNDTFPFYCKGALIAPEWILTSTACYLDPFKARESALRPSSPAFVVKLANSEILLEVVDQIDSEDLTLSLWRLAKPVTNAPLKLSSQNASRLLDTQVRIFGNQSSEAAKHIIYNPYQGANISCTVGGSTFRTSDTICYLLGRTTASTTLLSASGTVIDPKSPSAPNSVLDTSVTIDTSGAHLYVDFRGSNSYPCHEDLGAPVVARNSAGELEQVGVVARTGMTLGLPMCTQTIANEIVSIAHYQAFITETMASHEFDLVCPPAPKPRVLYTGGTGVTLSWAAVPGATGYRILYTTDIGFSPIKAVNAGSQTQVSTNLSPSFTYTATVIAYNDACSGAQSEQLTIDL